MNPNRLAKQKENPELIAENQSNTRTENYTTALRKRAYLFILIIFAKENSEKDLLGSYPVLKELFII